MTTRSLLSPKYWRKTSIFCAFLLLSPIACEDRDADPSKVLVKELPASKVLLTYQGGQINAGDLHEQIAPTLERLREETVSLYRKEAEALVVKRISEAQARAEGFQTETAYRESLKAKVRVSDSEVLDFMKRNHLPMNSKKEEIRNFLVNQSALTQDNELRKKILKEAKIDWKINSLHHEFKNKTMLSPKGQSDAAVVIQEFCDFGNPLCSPARLGIEQLLSKYPKGLLVYFHPIFSSARQGSQEGSIAAFCGAQQGKFWELSGQLFDHEAKLNAEAIQKIAVNLKLDLKIFQSCLIDPKTNVLAQEETTSAKSGGILETPTFFVNGEMASSLDDLNQRVEKLMNKNEKQ